MNHKLIVSMGALALLASVGVAEAGVASVAKRFVTFGVGGGASVPVSDAGDVFKNGFNVQGYAQFHMPVLPVMPRLDLNYSKFNLDDAQTLIPGTGQILSGLASVQMPLVSFGPIRPYITAGLGAYSLTTETEGPGGVSTSDVKSATNGAAAVKRRRA